LSHTETLREEDSDEHIGQDASINSQKDDDDNDDDDDEVDDNQMVLSRVELARSICKSILSKSSSSASS
jgi:hypothetical protein